MKLTTNLGLKKPEGADTVDINDLNDNADVLDTELVKLATTAAPGRMSAADKGKLDGIAAGANNYVHPSSHPASIITQDANNRFVTDAEKAAWNAKETTSGAQAKVDTHAADTVKHITAAERTLWNAKASTSAATSSAAGLMSAADKSKLDGVAAGAQPNPGVATTSANGLMSAADKSKLNGVATGAQVNTVTSVAGRTGAVTLAKGDVGLGNVDNVKQAPLTHVGSGGTAHAAATSSTAGFMSAADKSKLDGISAGAQVNRTLATQAQAQAGTDSTTDMTPQRTMQAIDSRTRYGVTTGTATALVLTLSPAPASLYTGLEVKVKLHLTTGTNPTLNVNSLGAKGLYDADGSTRFSGESGKIYTFIYDGTNFIQASGGGGGKLNVFSGNTQPSTKQGVYIQGEYPISNIVFTDNVWNADEWKPMLSGLITPDNNTWSAPTYKSSYIYFMGGLIGTSTTNRNTRLDVNTGVTSSMAVLSLGNRYGSAVFEYNNKIYCFGGFITNSHTTPGSEGSVYDIATNTWSSVANCPNRLYRSGQIRIGDYFYIIGGYSNTTPSIQRVLNRYDILNNTWDTLSSPPNYTHSGAVGFWEGKIIYAGGLNATSSSGNNSSFYDIFIYDINENTWSKSESILPFMSLSNTLDGGAYVQDGKYLYMVSGGTQNSVWKLNLSTLEATEIGQNTNDGYKCINLIERSGVPVILGTHTASNNYGTREISMTPLTLPDNCAVVMRSDNRFGQHYTEFYTNKNITGAYPSFQTGFDNVYYHSSGVINRNLSTFKGNGLNWVKFK